MTGYEISVEMGLQDMGYPVPHVQSGFNVNLHVTAGVHNGAFLLSAYQVGAVRDSFQEKLLYKHGVTSGL